MKQEYFLGLDMGTNSVGWAVTDMEYRLIRKKGKDLWGIREFDEAQTAVERRAHRISRRRRQREQVRIGLLKSYFEEAIAMVDPEFYLRLENSKYYLEDKQVDCKYGIFNNPNYTDVDYYKEFPTIFHLRKKLIENEKEYDVRLVYLALLNMFKSRGHFLYSGVSGEGSLTIERAYADLCECLGEILEVSFPCVDTKEMENIIGDRKISKSVRAEKLGELLGIDKKDKREIAIIKAICGLKVNVSVIFGELPTEEKLDISFSDFGYDEKCADIEQVLGEDNYQVLEVMKQVYDVGTLAGFLKGQDYLSFARVQEYEKHKSDLKMLKALYKKYLSKEEYDFMFRSDEAGTYSAYVNSVNSGKKQRRSMGNRKREDFYKTIKKALTKVEECEEKQYIFTEMEKETFLPKQLTAANGVIPNQIHAIEMKTILNNAEGYLPFLLEKDESGLTISERILKLFQFQIPYYIGPVSENSKTGWVVRKEAGEVLPWNYKDKIDITETSKEFINRLIRNCTYLAGEKVLPKASLMYEKYCVLNEINNIKIDNERLSVEVKQEIYEQLFQKEKKITRKKLETFLVGKGLLVEKEQLTGIDININSSLSSYRKFYEVFGEKIKEDKYYEMAEDIIHLSTVFGDSRQLLRDQIEKKYGAILSKQEIKRITGFKFKDWARLSKAFLLMKGCDKTTGEEISIMNALWENNMNLMEIINDEERFSFRKELTNKQNKLLKSLSDIQIEDLDEYYFSAPVKRMVWQTLLIMREIKGIMGSEPKRVFVEMTRKDDVKGEKGRKDSRKKQLLELYKSIKDDREWEKEIEGADSNGSLRSKKLYLYYRQMGRCMYTGKEIDLYTLLHSNEYDIDHIYPRHYVKDDNIENNLVLVSKQSNAYKSDSYPIEETTLGNLEVRNLWNFLKEKKFISEEKYRRLTGRTPFTDEQKAGFIARQLVETSQATKGIADILQQIMPESEVVYVKGSNVSEFRNMKFENYEHKLLKSRLVNDFHHAKDAYLNIVVGNVFFVKFTKNPLNFIQKEYGRDAKKYHYNLGKMYEWDVIRGEEVAWIAQKKDSNESATIEVVQKMMAKNTPMMTRLSYVVHGGIAKETLHPAKKAKVGMYLPLKSTDERMQNVKKYGGFSDVSTAYFFLVEHEIKGERVLTIEMIPVHLVNIMEGDKSKLIQYCLEDLKLCNPCIKLAKIKKYSVFEIEGYRMYISGKMNGGAYFIFWNATNLCLNQEWINYVKNLEMFVETEKEDERISSEKNIELYNILAEKHSKGIFGKRVLAVGELLVNSMKNFENLELLEQCIVIKEIMRLSAISKPVADLSLIGGSKNAGVLYISKKLSGLQNLRLINQSVTGFYEESIDLLTL